MPIVVGNPVWITLIADADTPAALQSHHGERVALPEGTVLPPVGQRDTLLVQGFTIHGYVRDGATGPEWVMTAATDPNVAALNAIPGPAGWSDQAARQTYITVFRKLLKLGVSGPEARPMAKQLYDATAADIAAKPPAP